MGKKKEKRIVVPRRVNFDVAFIEDMCTGNGFVITEPSGITINNMSTKSLNGAQSPLYGVSIDDEQSYAERWRCDCGALIGHQHVDGDPCPICGTKVRTREANVKMTGWICTGYHVINPYYYHLLAKAIGTETFDQIITGKTRITTSGQRARVRSDDNRYEEPKSDYAFIGMQQFFALFDEIMDYFAVKKPTKKEIFNQAKVEKRIVFTTHIPIYTTLLRPQSLTSDTFYYGTVDTRINQIFSLSETLKTSEDIERDYNLIRLQTNLNLYWETVIDLLKGKEGWIRDKILGGSLNYTSRNVIIPDPTLKDNEVDLCYHAVLEMYKSQIINYIRRLDGCTLSEAKRQWEFAKCQFDEKVYQIMCHVVDTEKPRLIINRNPTLNYYSILLMKIRNIVPDIDNYTLSVPLSILPGLNADFDGDILNIIALMHPAMVYMFRKYDPVMRMIIDRDTGLLNDYFAITKGALIDLYAFVTLEAEEGCETPETFKGPDGKYYTQEELDAMTSVES